MFRSKFVGKKRDVLNGEEELTVTLHDAYVVVSTWETVNNETSENTSVFF